MYAVMELPDAEDLEQPNNYQVPVLNEFVVEHIMSYLELTDLKSCRKVNKTWMYAVRKHLLKKGSITEGLIWKHCSSALELTEKLLSEIGSFGFKNLSIDLRSFFQNEASSDRISDFLSCFGSKFENVKMKTTFQTINLIFQFTDFLTNIKSLHIILTDFTTFETQFIDVVRGRDNQSIKKICIEVEGNYKAIENRDLIAKYKMFFLRLFQKFTNLESIELLNSPRTNQLGNSNINLLLKILDMLFWEHNVKLNLSQNLCDLAFKRYGKELSVMDLAIFYNLSVRFRKLYFPDYMSFHCGIQAFRCGEILLSILESQSVSLVELSMKLPTCFIKLNHFNENDDFYNFPTFPCLKKLEMEICFTSNKDFSVLNFRPIRYDVQFPLLEELILVINCSEYGFKANRYARRIKFLNQFFGDVAQVCTTLQRLDLRLPYSCKVFGDKAPDLLKSWIPNLSCMFPNVNNHSRINEFRSNYL